MPGVAIVGVGQTVHGKRTEVSYPELVREAVSACLRDAGVAGEEIEAVVTGSMPAPMEGVEAPELWLVEGCGVPRARPLVRIATCGTTGMSIAHCAYYHIASGLFDLVLAVGWEKMYQNDPQGVMSTVADPFFQRAFLAGAPGAIALQSRDYIRRFSLPPARVREAAARVSVRNHRAALKNPFAHIKVDISVDDVLTSRVICDPLRILDCCPSSDGACALLFASEGKARRMGKDPAWVIGLGYAGDEYFIGDKDLADWESAKEAARQAYRMAGIKDPLRDLDLAEVYNPFTFQELIFYEAFGFCPPGQACALVESGLTEPEGEFPVCPSGGVLCTNPIGATGLLRVAEAALQVMGKAGERQVRKRVDKALAHAWGGAIQFNGVMVLARTL